MPDDDKRAEEGSSAGGSARAASSAPVRPHQLLKGIRVLLVDDDPIVRMVVRRTLGRFGGKVETAATGEAALETLRGSLFSIILLELELPGVDGLAVAKEIRDRRSSVLHHEVAIVALTSRATEEDRKLAAAAGMDALLAKPVRVRDLLKTIRRLSESSAEQS